MRNSNARIGHIAARAAAALALAPFALAVFSLCASALTVTITSPSGGLWTASDTSSLSGTATGATADRLTLDSDQEFAGGNENNVTVGSGVVRHEIPSTETWRYQHTFSVATGQGRIDRFWMWPLANTTWAVASSLGGVQYPPSLIHTGVTPHKAYFAGVLPGPLVNGTLAFTYTCEANGALTVEVSSDGRNSNESLVIAAVGPVVESGISYNLTGPLAGSRAIYVRLTGSATSPTQSGCSVDDFQITAEYTRAASSQHRFTDDFAEGLTADENAVWGTDGSGWAVTNLAVSDTTPSLTHLVGNNSSIHAQWGFSTVMTAANLSFHYQCEANAWVTVLAGNILGETVYLTSAVGAGHTAVTYNVGLAYSGSTDFHVRFRSDSNGATGTLCGIDDFVLNVTLVGHQDISYPGSYTSPVVDLGQASNFTAVDWNGSTPGGTTSSLYFRASSNNVSFSSWAALASSPAVPSPLSGRYVQFRADFTSRPGLSSATVDRIGLNFSGVERIEVSVNGGPWAPASGASAWTASVNLGPGSNNITVRATDSTGATATSVVQVLRDTFPPAAPGAPQGPAVTNQTDATWTWAAAADTGLGVSHYLVDVGLTPGGVELGADIVVTGTNYTATGLPDNQRVYVTARAVDYAGLAGPRSAASAGTLVDRTPPGPVSIQGPAPYTRNTTLVWSWSAALDYGSLVAAYNVRVGHSAGAADVASATTTYTNFTFQPAVTGEVYVVTVSAVDSAGNEGPRVFSAATTIDTQAPTGPATATGPSGVSNSSSLTWTWPAATDALSGVDYYIVSVGTSPGTHDIVEVAWYQATYTVSFVPAGARYYFEVRSVDRAGNVGAVLSAPPVLVDDAAPTAPSLTAVSAFVGNSSQVIAWTASDDQPSTNASGIDHYIVRVTAGTALAETEVALLTHTLTLTDGTHYTVAVAAVDRAGNEGASATLAFTADMTGPLAPTNVRVVVSDTTGPSLTATWNGTSDAGAGLKEYRITVGTTPGGSDVIGEGTVTGTTYTFTGRFDTPYFVSVWGVDNLGNAGAKAGNPVGVAATKPSTGGGFLPGAPAGLAAVALLAAALFVAGRNRKE